MRNKIFSVLSLLCFTFMTTSIVGETAAEAANTKAKKCPGTVRVLTETLSPVSFDEYVSLEEVALPLQVSDIVNAQAGTVVKIEKPVGSLVKAGDVIMILDVGKSSAELTQAQEELKKAQRVLRARQNWKVRSSGAEKQAASKVADWEAQVAQIEAMLAATQVLAPVDGTIAKLQVSEGEHISQEFIIGTIHDLSQLRFSLDAQAVKVTDGQTILVKIRETEIVLDGMVKKAASEKAELVINNAEGKVLPGQHGTFEVLVQNYPSALVVDQKVLLKDDAGSYVFIVNGKRARKTPVNLGAASHGKQVVSFGLFSGNQLIVAEVMPDKAGTIQEGFPCLADNKKVKIVNKPAEAVKTAVKETPVEVKTKPVPVKVVTKEPQKEIVPEMGFSRFHVGVGANFYGMMDTEDQVGFKYYYSNLLGFGIDAGYRITRAMDVTASFSFANSQEKEVDWSTENLKFSLKAITLDLRYAFLQGRLMDVYGGAGISLYPYEDIAPEPFGTTSGSAFGVNFMAGTYVHLIKKLDFHFGFRYNLVKKSKDSIDGAIRDLILNNGELIFGLSYNF